MFSHRSIAWTAALRDFRADRVQMPPDERRTLLRRETFIKIAVDRARLVIRTSPLVFMGRYDRRAIMCTAIAAAKARHAATGEPWRICLSAALKGTWLVAKDTRLSAVPHQQKALLETSELLQRFVGTRQDGKIAYPNSNSHEASPSQRLRGLPCRPHRKPTPPLLGTLVSTPLVSR